MFDIFHEHSNYGHFKKKNEIHIKGKFVKITEFTVVINFEIFTQISDFRLKISILNNFHLKFVHCANSRIIL